MSEGDFGRCRGFFAAALLGVRPTCKPATLQRQPAAPAESALNPPTVHKNRSHSRRRAQPEPDDLTERSSSRYRLRRSVLVPSQWCVPLPALGNQLYRSRHRTVDLSFLGRAAAQRCVLFGSVVVLAWHACAAAVHRRRWCRLRVPLPRLCPVAVAAQRCPGSHPPLPPFPSLSLPRPPALAPSREALARAGRRRARRPRGYQAAACASGPRSATPRAAEQRPGRAAACRSSRAFCASTRTRRRA